MKNVKESVEWAISAQFPACTISKNFIDNTTHGTHYDSKFLINNGYIKKEGLLDVDNESYCDVSVDVKIRYENPLDHQNNGYGSELLFFIKAYSKKIGCSEMFVITDKGNARACHVYEKLGGKNDIDDEIVYVYDYE